MGGQFVGLANAKDLEKEIYMDGYGWICLKGRCLLCKQVFPCSMCFFSMEGPVLSGADFTGRFPTFYRD